jgi:hypothetical protein
MDFVARSEHCYASFDDGLTVEARVYGRVVTRGR